MWSNSWLFHVHQSNLRNTKTIFDYIEHMNAASLINKFQINIRLSFNGKKNKSRKVSLKAEIFLVISIANKHNINDENICAFKSVRRTNERLSCQLSSQFYKYSFPQLIYMELT